MKSEADTFVAEVVRRAEEIEAPVSSDMFDNMYAKIPEILKLQRQTLRTSSLGQDPAQLPNPDPATT